MQRRGGLRPGSTLAAYATGTRILDPSRLARIRGEFDIAWPVPIFRALADVWHPRHVRGRLPNYLIIGAAKSGTTSLARYLQAHPDCFMHPLKEVNFFDFPQVWKKGVGWYKSEFARAGRRHAVGEASPGYMSSPRAMPRIRKIIPDAKLIAILRNPADRAYSHYWHLRMIHAEHRPFEEAIALDGRRKEMGERDFSYIERGRYLKQLQQVREHFPEEQLQVLLFDDLREKPEDVFAQVCRFLEIDDSVRPSILGQKMNGQAVIAYPRLWNTMLRVHLRRYVPDSTIVRIAEGLMKPATHPPVDHAVRAELLERFAPDNAELGEWLGRDLVSLWS
jgi:hypothetical protein